MNEWTKVVSNPLGLAGFALFLVFGYLARVKRNDERRWLSPVAVALAFVALAGGLILSYIPTSKLSPPASPSVEAPTRPQVNKVQQSTTGDGSPAVQGTQGDVTITIDQSSGKTKLQKPADKKASDEKP
jgi:hypothetical protein